MYRLYEVTKKADKETQRILDFPTSVGARGEYETNLSNAIKATDEEAHFLMILDQVGNIVCKKFVGDGEITPRLIDVKSDAEGEHPNMAKYDTLKDVEANFHMKYGSALKKTDVLAIMLRGIDQKGNSLEYVYEVIDRNEDKEG